jgi:hypothetical protein
LGYNMKATTNKAHSGCCAHDVYDGMGC